MTRQPENQYEAAASPVADRVFDVAITGGGLAGLALSIQLARSGYLVALSKKKPILFTKCVENTSVLKTGIFSKSWVCL